MTSITIAQPRESRIAILAAFLMDSLRTWQQNALARRQLAGISARDLRDAGFNVNQVNFELAQPFWRSLRRER